MSLLKLTRVATSLATHLGTYAGATIVNLRDRLDEAVSVKDFGAKGDAVSATVGTDDTAAIQRALNSGAKRINFPKGMYRVTDTLTVPDGVVISGAGILLTVIIADPSLEGTKDVFVNSAYSASTVRVSESILVEDLTIHANGMSRTKTGVGEWGRCFRVACVMQPIFRSVAFVEGPQHCLDITNWKDTYIGIGHAGVAQGPCVDALVQDCHFVDYVYDDGLTTHAVRGVTVEGCTSTITDAGKAKHPSAWQPTQSGFEIDDGSQDVFVTNCRSYVNGTLSRGFTTACHADAPATFNVHFDNIATYGAYISVNFWADKNTTAGYVIGTDSWKCRNFRVTNLLIEYPAVDTTNTIFPSRAIDVQAGMDVNITGVRVNMGSADGLPARTPVVLFSIADCVNYNIEDVYISGVPDGNVGSAIAQSQSWFRIVGVSDNITIRNVGIDKMGWVNRLIRDIDKNPGGALKCVEDIRVGSIVSDGQAKIGVMSAAFASFSRISVPVGMDAMRIGRTLSVKSIVVGDVRLNSNKPDAIIGGLIISSDTTADGKQPCPAILFDRQFVSASDPTGVSGKGTLSFRTSDTANGSFSISAYHEDLGEYRPVVYARSTTTPAKAWNPVIDNDTSLGEASNRWNSVYSATGAIQTSDINLKTDIEELDEVEKLVAVKLRKLIKRYRFKQEKSLKASAGVVSRLHIGVMAQEVESLFKEHGLNAFDYGLLCYDKWGDEFIEVDSGVDEKTLVKTMEAGSRYSIRYDELMMFMLAAL